MKFRLSDICDIKVGFPFKSNGFNENGDGVRLVRGMNISKNGFRWGNQTRWWNNVTHDLDDYFLKENDVLVAMDGNVSTNFVNVSKEDLPLLLVQRVARLRSKIKPSNIIWYIVKSPNFGAYLNSVKTGTTISHISSKQIGDFEVDLPDFEYLENVCTILSTLDDKIKRNNQINDNLSNYLKLSICKTKSPLKRRGNNKSRNFDSLLFSSSFKPICLNNGEINLLKLKTSSLLSLPIGSAPMFCG